MHPGWLNVYESVSLLKEDNIGRDFCAGGVLKGVIRQSNCSEQIRSLCDILSHSGIFLVHRALRGDEGDDTAGSHLVEGTGKEIVVNKEIVLVVTLIRHLELTERNIADRRVKEAVGKIGFLKALHGDARILIKLLCDTARDIVKLHAVEPCSVHAVGHKSHKIADSAGWLQHIARLEIHILKCFIHCLYDNRWSIERRKG